MSVLKVSIVIGGNLSRMQTHKVDLSLLDPDFIDDCFMTTMLPFLASEQIAEEKLMTFATPAHFPERTISSGTCRID